MPDRFDELRETLARAQEQLEKMSLGVTQNYVDPVVGQETPIDALIYVSGFATMTREQLLKDIGNRLLVACRLHKDGDILQIYHFVFRSGVFKAMLETEILHQGKEL